MKTNKLFIFLLLGIFLISFTSALEFDNIKTEKEITFDGINIKDIPLLQIYKPIRIDNIFGLGETLFEGYLSQHTETCGIDCKSTMQIKLNQDGVLIDDIIFKTLQEDGNWIEEEIKSYKFIVNGKNYNLGDEVKEGIYKVEIIAEKNPYKNVDWIITTQGKQLTGWATWYNYTALEMKVLLIGGGGGGGSIGAGGGGGGGAGGFYYNESAIISAINYSVIVGEGGSTNTNGENSILGDLVAIGGGAGGSGSGDNGNTGGSGGGGGGYEGSGTNLGGIGSQGNNGGTGKKGADYPAGGGGGAGTAGSDYVEDCSGSDDCGGDGGNGLSNSISGSSIIYAGGGGGGSWINGGSPGVGGTGGGGDGSKQTGIAVNGTNGLGGGGGGCGDGGTAGTGGSGIVIISYETILNEFFNITGGTKTTSGDNTIHTFTSDGDLKITPIVTLSIVLNSPLDNSISQTLSTVFNSTAEISGGATLTNMSLWTNESGSWEVRNITTGLSTSNHTQEWIRTLSEGQEYIWNVQSCTSDGDCEFGISNYTVSVDTQYPIISAENPMGTLGYSYVGNNETLNITFTDSNLDSCWYDYNGTNITIDGCLTGVKNSTTFTLEEDNLNMTIYANDTLGNLNSSFISWDYIIFKSNITYNEEVLDLSLEDFVLYIQATEEITSAKMNYNGTDYSSNILSLGSGLYKIWNSIQVPDVDVDTNATFYFNMTTSSNIITTESFNQSVYVLLIDDCSSYSNEIFDIDLYDEKTLLDLDGTIEVNLELFNSDKSTALATTQEKFYNVSNSKICTNVNLTETGYYYDLELRYYVDPTNTSTFLYVPEFYHIQKASTSNFPQSIELYNLNVNQSAEFEMFYRDNDYTARSNILLQVERKYVSEGIFRTVEIPITSSEGTAIAHFDLDNYKYKIIATYNGEILNIFDNPAIVCESELTSTCSLELNGRGSPDSYRNIDEVQGISYSITQGANNVTVDYSIPTGETKTVRVWMIQYSPFTDPTTLCNSSITSSSGSFVCIVNSTIGDSEVVINLLYNGIERQARAYFQEDLNIIFQKNNYAIAALFIIFLVTMFVSSPKIMITVGIFSIAILGFLFLIKGSSIGMTLGAISYLILAGIIILIKINKKDET